MLTRTLSLILQRSRWPMYRVQKKSPTNGASIAVEKIQFPKAKFKTAATM